MKQKNIQKNMKEAEFLSRVIGKPHTRHNYGDKLYNEEREKAKSIADEHDDREKKARLKKLRDMGMI